MKHVYNETQLRQALNQGEQRIILHGDMADTVARKYQAKRRTRTGGLLLAAGGLLALPFTGGLSASAVATGLTVSAVSISAAELAILVGGTVALASISRGYNVKMNSDGSVELEKR